jgi:hypothetical protein
VSDKDRILYIPENPNTKGQYGSARHCHALHGEGMPIPMTAALLARRLAGLGAALA